MSPFALHLADIRRRHGLSQEEMAKKLGVAAAYLCAVENGAKPISEGLLRRLEEVFANNVRDRTRLMTAASTSVLQRRMPKAADTKAYFFVNDLWDCMQGLESDDWVALHSVLDVIRTNRQKKLEGSQMNTG